MTLLGGASACAAMSIALVRVDVARLVGVSVAAMRGLSLVLVRDFGDASHVIGMDRTARWRVTLSRPWPPLLFAIFHVVVMRAQEQMRRVHAQRHVAFVAHD